MRTVLVVDDHPVFRLGLSLAIGDSPDVCVCGEAATADEAMRLAKSLRPDLVILDLRLPGADGLSLMKSLLADRPDVRVLILSMQDDPVFALKALRAGAKGYVLKQEAAGQVMEAIRTVLAGGIYVTREWAERPIFRSLPGSKEMDDCLVKKLSDRESEVLEHMGRGQSTRQIADSLGLSVKTVETHRAHIKEKLGLHNAEEMVDFAEEWMAATRD